MKVSTLFAAIALSVNALGWGVAIAGEQPQSLKPDTLLVLKNGAEVRGSFIVFKDGSYTLRLADGRTMNYPSAEVDRMDRLEEAAATTDQRPPSSQTPAPAPFSCRTFVSQRDIDKAYYTTLKDIKVSKKWYGSNEEMYGELADEARSVGADGVINVRTWKAPSGFAWAAPHAGGMAIKWTQAGRAALQTLDGRCY